MKNVADLKLIKKFIKENNLTKKAFCEMCHISVSRLNRVFLGKNVYISVYFKIAKVLDIPVYKIFK